MNKKEISIVLGIMCFVLVIAISIQLKTIWNSNSTAVQTFTQNNLRDQVLSWKEKYEREYEQLQEAEKKLETVRQQASANNSESSQTEEDIKKANLLLGLTDVTGSGITITLKDSQSSPTDVLSVNNLLIHNDNLVELVNELKNAGAEAISINDQRIVSTSSIICDGNVVRVNGEKIGVPFVVKAIGSPEWLLGAIDRPGGIIPYMKENGITSEIKKSNNLTILKFTGVFNNKYVRNAE